MLPPDTFAENTPVEEIPLLRHVSAARIFALFIGAFLTVEALLAFVPAFSQGGLLFHTLAVDWRGNLVHLVTGLAGLAIGALRLSRWERPYTVVMITLYTLLFVFGEVKVERAANAPANVYGQDTLLGWLMALNTAANVLHLLIALLALFALLFAAFQKGARATQRADALGQTHHIDTPLPTS